MVKGLNYFNIVFKRVFSKSLNSLAGIGSSAPHNPKISSRKWMNDYRT